jgi:ribosomal protein S18 acetylase RimI-like enzyme
VGRARRADVRPARPRLRGRVLALPGLTIRPLDAADRGWADQFLAENLGGRAQARRGELVDVLDGDGCVAELEDRPVGLITWTVPPGRSEAEVRAVAVTDGTRGRGIGRALFAAAEEALRSAGVQRAWLVTTNDNLAALALYQKAGWRLHEVRHGAIDELRRTIKPSIPATGQGGIPLRDELELTKEL